MWAGCVQPCGITTYPMVRMGHCVHSLWLPQPVTRDQWLKTTEMCLAWLFIKPLLSEYIWEKREPREKQTKQTNKKQTHILTVSEGEQGLNSRCECFLEALRDSPFLAPPKVWGLPHILSSLASRHFTPWSPFPFSPNLCHLISGSLGQSHLQRSFFPNRVTLTGPRDQDWDVLLVGPLFTLLQAARHVSGTTPSVCGGDRDWASSVGHSSTVPSHTKGHHSIVLGLSKHLGQLCVVNLQEWN